MSASNEMTAEESHQANVAAMGVELGETYSALWQQLAWLHQKWGHFVQAFGTSPERIALLNEAGSQFFGTVQDALWENVLLHIARLTDPPSSVGKSNLSFKRLPQLISDAVLAAELPVLLQTLDDEAAFARDWRNRRIAHGDLELALGRSSKPLAIASRLHVGQALAAMGEVLNAVSRTYLDRTTFFEFAAEASSGGAVTVLHYLREGLDAEARRRERLHSGTYTEEDLRHRPL